VSVLKFVILSIRSPYCSRSAATAPLQCKPSQTSCLSADPVSQHLAECIRISSNLPQVEGIGHQARADYRLSQILRDLGKGIETMAFLKRAISLRESFIRLHGEDADLGRVEFDDLVPWMLW
jgi:hypothetical protein